MSHRFRVSSLLLALALVLAGPASAHGWKKHHKHRHHRHHHGCGHGGTYAPAPHAHHYARPYPVYSYVAPVPYYCGPCAHHFDSYDDLSYHVHRRHHVAVFELPRVIFQASIGGGVGWMFED